MIKFRIYSFQVLKINENNVGPRKEAEAAAHD
jgi:hypothetical protein